MIIPIILSGGMGTRLWPSSRRLQPKQLMSFDGGHTLLQHALRRANGHGFGSPIIICNESHRFIVAEQRALGREDAVILLEPEGNTAPAIALGAFQALEQSQDAIMVVMPADHIIGNLPEFRAVMQRGADLARDGYHVFGVEPHGPETGLVHSARAKFWTQRVCCRCVCRKARCENRTDLFGFGAICVE